MKFYFNFNLINIIVANLSSVFSGELIFYSKFYKKLNDACAIAKSHASNVFQLNTKIIELYYYHYGSVLIIIHELHHLLK